VGHGPTERALIDQSWRGYDPRAGFPVVAVAAVISAALLSGRWYLDDLSGFADRAGALAVYAMTLAVWPGLMASLLYRMITYTYRLTDRAVLIDWGFLCRPEPPVWLADLTGVEAVEGWLGRRFGVGRVTLRAGGREVTLRGVADPAGFAAAIRDTAARLKTAAS
jgi:membrane protein YdbS with pleckstrin-like domain